MCDYNFFIYMCNKVVVQRDINRGSKSYSRQASLLDQYFQNEYLFIIKRSEVIGRIFTIKYFIKCFMQLWWILFM